ncbi:MAG: metallophosphoesterase [Nitrospinota bacterium]
MKWFAMKIIFLLTLAMFVSYSLEEEPLHSYFKKEEVSKSTPHLTSPHERGGISSLPSLHREGLGEGWNHKNYTKVSLEEGVRIQKIMAPFPQDSVTRIVVVGDTGIGERAYHPGFVAVQRAMRRTKAEALLHLGDFVYQPEFFPSSCPDRYVKEIKETLSDPYPIKLFVVGDNDLPPKEWKPKASGCWNKINHLDSRFDTPGPRPLEGTRVIGNALIGVIHNYPWKDPTPWLAPRILEARKKGMWVILAVHEPAITTAWYLEKRKSVFKQLNALKPDIVLAGNQHSYERFHPTGPVEEGAFRVSKSESGKYESGEGTMHIVSGGGGATFKPFADLQKNEKRTAPKEIFDALAKRALMNHFITLDVSNEKLEGQVWRVCVEDDPQDKWDPRWKANKNFWQTIPLECDGRPEGVDVYEKFEIVKKPRKPYLVNPELSP